MSSWIDFTSLGKVLAASLIGGVGLAVFFALGLVGVSAAVGDLDGNSATSQAPAQPMRLSGWLLAVVSFVFVALGIIAGLYVVLTD